MCKTCRSRKNNSAKGVLLAKIMPRCSRERTSQSLGVLHIPNSKFKTIYRSLFPRGSLPESNRKCVHVPFQQRQGSSPHERLKDFTLQTSTEVFSFERTEALKSFEACASNLELRTRCVDPKFKMQHRLLGNKKTAAEEEAPPSRRRSAIRRAARPSLSRFSSVFENCFFATFKCGGNDLGCTL